MQRRDFLITGVGGLLAAGVSTQRVTAQAKPRVEIIDTHTHFVDPTRPQGE